MIIFIFTAKQSILIYWINGLILPTKAIFDPGRKIDLTKERVVLE